MTKITWPKRAKVRDTSVANTRRWEYGRLVIEEVKSKYRRNKKGHRITRYLFIVREAGGERIQSDHPTRRSAERAAEDFTTTKGGT